VTVAAGDMVTPAAVATTRHPRPGLATPYVPPSGPVEEALAAIWEDILGIAPVGGRDSFFDLGGHSLLAAKLIGRLTARFGVELPLDTLFAAPVLADLAERITEQELQEADGDLLAEALAELAAEELETAGKGESGGPGS
jgi:acyl carrier protein